MNHSKSIRTLLITALAIGLTGTFVAQGFAENPDGDSVTTKEGRMHQRGKHHRGMRHRGKALGPIRVLLRQGDTLGVDADTQTAIKDVLKSSRDNAKANRAANKANRQALREALSAPTVDEALVMTLAADISTAKAAAFQDRIATALQVRSLVTAEQWTAAETLMKERRGKRGKRGKMGKRGKRGDFERPAPVEEEDTF